VAAIALCMARPAVAAGPVVQVFAAHDGSAYDRWLQDLVRDIPEEVARFEFVPTEGSQDNLLKLRDAGAGIALVQRDVLAFAAAGAAQTSSGVSLKALANAFEEQVWVAGPRDTTEFGDLAVFDVGASTTGSAFTLTLLDQSWSGFAPLELRSLGAGDLPGLQWAAELDADRPRGIFRVNAGHPWSVEALDEAGLKIVPLGSARLQRAVLADPAYRVGRAQGEPTLAVDAILVATEGLDATIATALLEVVMGRFAGSPDVTRPGASPELARAFYDLDLPEHPALIRLKLGPRPYSTLIFALGVLTLILGLHLWLWRRGTYRRMAADREWRPGRERRVAGLVALLLALLTWTIASCMAIKYLELGPMLAGEDASEMWRMGMGALLRWMFVLVTVGYEADIFPVTSGGQILAASVQTGAYAGLVLVVSNLFLGAVETMMKRYLNRGVDMELDDHLVICNWTPEAEVILRELRVGESLAEGSRRRPVVIVSEDDLGDLTELYPDVWSISGRPSLRLPLEKAEVGRASAAIVLRSDPASLRSDAATATTCLAIRSIEEAHAAERTQGPIQILAEVLDPAAGRDLGRFGIEGVGRDGPFELDLLAETVVSPRVSRFYEELLRFCAESVELYSVPVPAAGRRGHMTFGTIVEGVYAGSLAHDANNPVLVIGVLPDGPTGSLLLNPREEDEFIPKLEPHARLLALAWDEPSLPDDMALDILDEEASRTATRLPVVPEVLAETDSRARALGQGLQDHVVVLNWNDDTPVVLERIRAAGMETSVVAVTNRPVVFENSRAFEGVSVIPMSPLADGALARVDLRKASTLLVLADRRLDHPDNATLLLVLRLRQLLEGLPPGRRPTISVEVIDPREVANIRAAGADEAVCGTEMLYRVFAQAVFNPAIVSCFRDLLRHSDDSCEAYVIEVPEEFVDGDAHFGTVVARAAENRTGDNPMVPVGYLVDGDRVILNPRGEERARKLTSEDRLLVLQYSR